ncbi:hypothetical protein H2O14_14350 [Rhizobium sp. G21]|nr:hypothetical protein [Rhizobium sp. G21]
MSVILNSLNEAFFAPRPSPHGRSETMTDNSGRDDAAERFGARNSRLCKGLRIMPDHDDEHMEDFLLAVDRRMTARHCRFFQKPCRSRYCRRAQSCQSIQSPGARLTCHSDSQFASNLNRVRLIILDIFRARHQIIRRPDLWEEFAEYRGIVLAMTTLHPRSPQYRRFEAWRSNFESLEARRAAGEFDKPIDTQAILAEARAELAETERMLKKYNID